MTRLRGSVIAAAVPLLLLSACAQATGTNAVGAPASGAPESSAPADQRAADDLVLRTESYGGFVPPAQTVGRLPSVSVYADGRVITDGPVRAIYPGPALPNIQVQMISPELVRELVRQGQSAGVKPGADFGRPNVADAPTTRVTLVTDQGATQSVAVEALRESRPDDELLTTAQRDARTKLVAFVKKLDDLQASPGVTPVAYQADRLAVLARPWADPGADPKSPEMAWPGPALPGSYLNANFKIGCVVVTGAEKDSVLAAAGKATQITPWTAGSGKYLVTFRPLLPDEDGCQVLKGEK